MENIKKIRNSLPKLINKKLLQGAAIEKEALLFTPSAIFMRDNRKSKGSKS